MECSDVCSRVNAFLAMSSFDFLSLSLSLSLSISISFSFYLSLSLSLSHLSLYLFLSLSLSLSLLPFLSTSFSRPLSLPPSTSLLGGELFELLNAGKNEGFVFREDRASQLMRDMISAVHYLHSKVEFFSDLTSYPILPYSSSLPSSVHLFLWITKYYISFSIYELWHVCLEHINIIRYVFLYEVFPYTIFLTFD